MTTYLNARFLVRNDRVDDISDESYRTTTGSLIVPLWKSSISRVVKQLLSLWRFDVSCSTPRHTKDTDGPGCRWRGASATLKHQTVPCSDYVFPSPGMRARESYGGRGRGRCRSYREHGLAAPPRVHAFRHRRKFGTAIGREPRVRSNIARATTKRTPKRERCKQRRARKSVCTHTVESTGKHRGGRPVDDSHLNYFICSDDAAQVNTIRQKTTTTTKTNILFYLSVQFQ